MMASQFLNVPFYGFLIFFRNLFQLYSTIIRYFNPSLSPKPHLIKYYLPTHPSSYPTYFHFPSSILSSQNGSTKKYPLLVNIHGGAFFMGDPGMDSLICSKLANEANCVVGNINYRKAPEHPFPAAVDDVDLTILAILEDESLSTIIDTSRIAIMGSSAGGGLALSACLNTKLKERGCIKGLIPMMAVTDCTLTKAQRLASVSVDAQKGDVLKNIHLMINVYMRKDEGYRTNPRASPVFADVGLLPERILVVSARLDCLFGEQKRFVERVRKERGDNGGLKWRVLEGLGHSRSRNVRGGDAVKQWDEIWGEIAEFLEEVWRKE